MRNSRRLLDPDTLARHTSTCSTLPTSWSATEGIAAAAAAAASPSGSCAAHWLWPALLHTGPELLAAGTDTSATQLPIRSVKKHSRLTRLAVAGPQQAIALQVDRPPVLVS